MLIRLLLIITPNEQLAPSGQQVNNYVHLQIIARSTRLLLTKLGQTNKVPSQLPCPDPVCISTSLNSLLPYAEFLINSIAYFKLNNLFYNICYGYSSCTVLKEKQSLSLISRSHWGRNGQQGVKRYKGTSGCCSNLWCMLISLLLKRRCQVAPFF